MKYPQRVAQVARPTHAPDACFLMRGQVVNVNGEYCVCTHNYKGWFDGKLTVQIFGTSIVMDVLFSAVRQYWN